LLLAVFAVLRIYAAVRAPERFNDTGTYFELDFFGGAGRLWTLPLLYNIVPFDLLREGVQVLIGIGAWSVLALTVYNSVQDRLVRRVGTVAVLLLGLTPMVTAWDAVILSESISTSLLVLLVALLLRLTSRATPSLLMATLGVMTLWVFTRQSNALLLVLLVPALAFICIRSLPRRRAVWTVSAVVLIAAWGGLATARSETVSRYAAVHLLVDDMAPDPSALRFLAARGLPVTPALLAERGNFQGGISPVFADRRLMRWIDERWTGAYLAYLAADPLHTLAQPLREAPAGLSSNYGSLSPRDVMPSPVRELVWATAAGDLVLWIGLGSVLFGAALRGGLALRRVWVVGVLLIAGLFGLYMTVHLSAYPPSGDLIRLLLPVGVMVRIALLILIVYSLEVLRTREDPFLRSELVRPPSVVSPAIG
jgi:hypothetical protein